LTRNDIGEQAKPYLLQVGLDPRFPRMKPCMACPVFLGFREKPLSPTRLDCQLKLQEYP
jgi:hypothetical protein